MTATHDLPVAAACRCASLSRSAYYNEPDHWTVRDAEIIAEQEMGSGLAKQHPHSDSLRRTAQLIFA